MLKIHNPKLLHWIQSRYEREDIQRLIRFLEAQGTFDFNPLPTGLFSAAMTNQETQYTGYQQAWVRDNIHVAHAHYVIGQTDVAVQVAIALMTYFKQYRDRFDRIIAQPELAKSAMNRPHIRFDGATLQELEMRWSHAQNDALGYFLWFYCKLVNEGLVTIQSHDLEILTLFPQYFQAIQYWQDADQGHWEETAKIEASSIGTVIAGLREFHLLGSLHGATDIPGGMGFRELEILIQNGEAALDQILPYECRQADERQRRYDSALLFLVYPLQVVDVDRGDRILEDVIQNLQGEIGIRRYLLDSFWAPDYKAKLEPKDRTTDMSEDLTMRDSLIEAGKEAQWCIFDPILSVIFGRKYQLNPQDIFLEKQIDYLNRSLGHLTAAGCPTGEFKCPELYYLEGEDYVPNDATPLLWTQANLRMALNQMEESLEVQV